ncbi:MAG TPA: GxxExxY protein [Kiritimatiellia bacterium]|nr:GxxExxY protein [Kiritimatiellia bacterium]HMP35336.1 GxxExxY protein [Kiritimatiellia bacterium]
MNTKELVHKEEVFTLVGVAMEVLNTLGHGFHEKPYENAMVVELELRGITYRQQPEFPILFKNVQVSSYIPDLIAFDKVIVDAKVIPAITDHERGQMLNYLRITGLRVGLIINFHKSKLEWERIVL